MGVDPLFVGRRAHLDVLTGWLDRARAGSPVAGLVEGAGGDGKTALVAEFAATCPATMVTVAGDADETLLAYGVHDQLMTRLERSDTDLRRPAERTPPTTADDVRRDVQLTGTQLLERLVSVASDRPHLLVVDDAHLADRESLSALGYALRRLRDEPVVTVLLVRPEGVASLPTSLVKLCLSSGPSLRVGGLDLTEVRELVHRCGQSALSDRLARSLLDQTAGSPLHLRALLQERSSIGGDLLVGDLPPPAAFGRLIARQFGELTGDGQRLASAAAVLGVRCDLRLASALATLPDPLPAVDELRHSRMMELVPGDQGATLAFTHTLVRRAIQDTLSPSRRAALHVAAGDLTVGIESLSHLAAATASFDTRLAGRFEAHAAAESACGGWRRAAHSLLEAARLRPPGTGREDAFLRGVDALLIAGDFAAAAGYRERVADLPPTLLRTQVLARIAWLAGEFQVAETLAEEAWASADRLDHLERDRLAGLLAQMCLMQGENQRAIVWAEEAMRSGILDRRRQASTLATLVAALGLEGRIDEAIALLPTDGDRGDAGYRELVGMRGIMQVLDDDPAGAAPNLRIRLRPNVADHSRGQTATDLLTATGPDGFEPNKLIVMTYLVHAEYRRGNWDVAAAVGEQAVALVEDTEQSWIAPAVHAAAALVPAARGQWRTAERHVATARAAAAQASNELNRGYTDDAAVHLATCRADPGEVVAAADWLVHSAQRYHQEPGLHRWPVHYASALVALGRYSDVLPLLDEWEAVARARGRRGAVAGLARVRGELAARRREVGAARHAFEDAARIHDTPFDVAEHLQFLLSRGGFLRRRGERRSAVADLELAESLATDLGAHPLLDRIRAELTASGRLQLRPAPPARERTDLTPQELAVARLVVSGMSNREVADSLVISPKTVAYHLGHVFAKLGVTSRGQLIASRQVEAS